MYILLYLLVFKFWGCTLAHTFWKCYRRKYI